MAYGTLEGFEAWLGSQVSSSNPGQYQQLTDKVNADTESDTEGQAALDVASSLIDSYLECRYAVPLTTVPQIIVLRTYQLAAWDLVTASGFNRSLEPIQRIRVMADGAMDWLEKVCTKVISLPGVDESNAGTSSSRTQVFIEDSQSVF